MSGWWPSIGRASPRLCRSAPARKWTPLCLHAIAAGALALRLAFVWRSEHLGHPDEVFQYLEQAHRLVYGYGFVPWEYRFARRNWLLPGTPPAAYLAPGKDGREPLQSGVDDRFTPALRQGF